MWIHVLVWWNEIMDLSPSKSSRRFGRFDSPFSSSTLHLCHFTNFSRVKFGIQQFQEESGQNRKIGMRGVHPEASAYKILLKRWSLILKAGVFRMLCLLKDLIAKLAVGLAGYQLSLDDQSKFRHAYEHSFFFLRMLSVSEKSPPLKEILGIYHTSPTFVLLKSLPVTIIRITRLIETRWCAFFWSPASPSSVPLPIWMDLSHIKIS